MPTDIYNYNLSPNEREMGNWCQQDCDGWHNMINFIRGVPYYSIADRCSTCDVWYPKHVLNRCPCCNTLLRRNRTRYAKGVLKSKDREDADKIKAVIRKQMDSGWTLLKPDVWKVVLEYRMAHKLPLK
jgi:hypothetical protein